MMPRLATIAILIQPAAQKLDLCGITVLTIKTLTIHVSQGLVVKVRVLSGFEIIFSWYPIADQNKPNKGNWIILFVNL